MWGHGWRAVAVVVLALVPLGLVRCSSPIEAELGQREPIRHTERAAMPTARGASCGTTLPQSTPRGVALPINAGGEVIAVDYSHVVGQGPELYGVEYNWLDQYQELYLERYRRLYGNVVRVQISQQVFEPVNDNDDPDYSEIDFSVTIPVDMAQGTTITYDDMLRSLAVEFPDYHFQANMWLAARWNAAEPNGYLGLGGAFPPIDYAEHREFVRAMATWLVEDCGIAPERLSVAFVNEVNLTSFFVGTQADLVRMAQETHAALDAVSPLIQMGGLDEVHGTAWTDEFYGQGPQGCCDLWSFHAYERGADAMVSALEGRVARLSRYGPVWVTEFADTANGSPDAQMDFSTRDAALGFSEMLGVLWAADVDGVVHFRLSDTYADLFGGWVGHGLFADARGTHSGGEPFAPFPVYWVFANMYRELGGGQIVSATAPSSLSVVAARRESGTGGHLGVWITNPTVEPYTTTVTVAGFATGTVQAQVFDNLAGDEPVETRVLGGPDIAVWVHVPSRSSVLLVLEALPISDEEYHLWLPLVLRTP